MSRLLLLRRIRASSKLPAAFMSYSRLFPQQSPSFLRVVSLSLLQCCIRGPRAPPPNLQASPEPDLRRVTLCLRWGAAEGGCRELPSTAASHPTSWLTTTLRPPATQHLAQLLCEGAALTFASLNTHIKFLPQ